jgi:hypothetical protein
MTNAVRCACCSDPMTPAEAEYSPAGDLVCRDCSLEGEMQRTLDEAEHAKGQRGGLLDRAFLSRLSTTGRRMYWSGQIVAVVALVAVLFGLMDLSVDEIRLPLVGGGLALGTIWGFICVGVWPRKALS